MRTRSQNLSENVWDEGAGATVLILPLKLLRKLLFCTLEKAVKNTENAVCQEDQGAQRPCPRDQGTQRSCLGRTRAPHAPVLVFCSEIWWEGRSESASPGSATCGVVRVPKPAVISEKVFGRLYRVLP